MKKIIYLSVILFFTGFSKVKAQQDYFVGFFGEKQNAGSVTGHAFVGIGKGTPLTCNLDGTETEMFGFYPQVSIQGGLSLWFGPVPSKVANDVLTNIDLYYFRKIEFADYIKVQLKIEDWKKKQYQLTRSDCISFFSDIASIFPDITIPDRSQFVLPETFVYQFIQLNKQ